MYDSLLANVLTGIALVFLFVGLVTLVRTPDRHLPKQTGRNACRWVRAFVLTEIGMSAWIAAGWIEGVNHGLGKTLVTVVYVGLLLWVTPKMKKIIRVADENDVAARAEVE